ncbi:hypothetical protein V8C26DRAFT_43832 [Trichoderma gracile]
MWRIRLFFEHTQRAKTHTAAPIINIPTYLALTVTILPNRDEHCIGFFFFCFFTLDLSNLVCYFGVNCGNDPRKILGKVFFSFGLLEERVLSFSLEYNHAGGLVLLFFCLSALAFRAVYLKVFRGVALIC